MDCEIGNWLRLRPMQPNVGIEPPKVGSNDGLGPLPVPAHFARVGDCEYRDCWNAQQVRAYALAEVERAIAPLRAELQRVQAYIDETPDLFEALGPIECEPNVELSRRTRSA